MTLNLLVQLRWANGGTPNLPASFAKAVAHAPGTPNVAVNSSDVDIKVTGDGGAGVAQNPTSSGVDYLVSAVGQNLSVSVTFWLTVPKPGGPKSAAFRGPTLSVAQTYSADGSGALTPKIATLSGGTLPGAHPLVQVSVGTPLADGTPAVTVTIDTTFVDVTDHWAAWMRMTFSTHWTVYQKLHSPDTTLAVLAYTSGNPASGGGPTYWFVSIPTRCAASSVGTVSTIVFFKPDIGYNTDRLTVWDHGPHGMYGMARFLLSPVHGAPEAWYRDRFSPPPTFHIWLCARMEAGLAASGKNALLVAPLAYNASYRDASTDALTSTILPSLLNTLYAVGKVAVGATASPSVGKTAVAGYSAGGGAAYDAVVANTDSIDEVYLFDPYKDKVNVKGMAPALATWAGGGKSARRLCIAWGNTAIADAQSCAAQVTATAPTATVVVSPAAATFYAGSGATPAGDPWWNDCAVTFPQMWTVGALVEGAKHQFAILGGDDPAFSSGSRITFFQSFLTGSTL